MIKKKDYTKKELTDDCLRYDYFSEDINIAIIVSTDFNEKRQYDIEIVYDGECYDYYYSTRAINRLLLVGYCKEGIETFALCSRSPFKTANNILEQIIKVIDYKKHYLKAIKKCQNLIRAYDSVQAFKEDCATVATAIEPDSELLSEKIRIVKTGLLSVDDLLTFLDSEIVNTNYPFKVR